MTKKILKYLLLSLIIISISSCSNSKKSVKMERVSRHFYPMPSKTKNLDKSWVIILPGYSGLKVFKDTGHYHRIAQDLNTAGFDVIIVEYKKAMRKGGYKFPWEFAKGIKWATEQAIVWSKSNGFINPKSMGHIVSWSAGGEGTILLMNDSKSIERLQISSVALFYPSNRDSTILSTNIPVLVQTGALDNVTPSANIYHTYGNQTNVEFIEYPGAHHGFDVESIVEEKNLRIPPLVGKKFIFQYSESANYKAKEKLIEFLKNN